MHNSNVSFAKIVATPLATAWSQVYNAGSLFAVLSLNAEHVSEEQPLNGIGKQIINNLEAEFFTLETKDLPSIKKAISESIRDIPAHIALSISLAYIKENVLYLLLYGPGKIILKRSGKIGPLLINHEEKRTIHTASGYIMNDDILLLQTEQFSTLVPEKTLTEAFELSLPSDIAETLTPHIHTAGDGSASAIIITFKGVPQIHHSPTAPTQHPSNHTEENIEDEPEVISPYDDSSKLHSTSKPNPIRSTTNMMRKVLLRSKKTLLFLIIAIILAGVLAVAVYTTATNKQNTQRKAAFEKIYADAEKEYDEGSGLINLNPVYAREDLQAAKTIIEKGLPQFPAGTPEEKKLQELLSQVNTALEQTGQVKVATVTETKKEESPLLAAIIETKGLYSTLDETKLYVVKEHAIVQIINEKEKEIIKNDEDWADVGGFSAYNGNIYVLDKKEGVLKFVAGAGGYGKSSYFTDAKPNISNATSMAIDGSIWILQNDGTILKYTKGKRDDFTIKGLEQPLKNPQAMYTDKNASSIYIVDNGNNRLVQLNKDGTYKAQYSSPTFQNVKQLEVNESAKTVFLLAGQKVFMMKLQ